MKSMPKEIGNTIFEFLIPNPQDIEFVVFKNNYYSNRTYNPQYEQAYLGDSLVKNKHGFYLSRIQKKNGKDRYYLSQELIDEIDVEYHGSGQTIYHYDYVSTFIGKNLSHALIRLLLL
jgi:hypothetical protein